MATYSYAQLEGLWINNGGSRATAPLAAAIAEAESAGQAAVTSANPDGGTNVGLWQLDTRGKGAGFTVQQLQDPATNAAVAVKGSSNGTDWSAWETFVTGAYRAFMNGSTTPDTSVPTSAAAASAQSSSDASASGGPECAWSIGGQHIGLVFGHGPSLPSACVIRKTEVRALMGGLLIWAGFGVMLPGLIIVMAYGFKASGLAGQAASAAGMVPGYGRAAKAAGAARGVQRASKPGGPLTQAEVSRGRRQAAVRARDRKRAASEARAESRKGPVVTDPAAGV